MGEVRFQESGDCQREPGFADAAGPGEREKADIGQADERANLGRPSLPADEAGQQSRQRWPGRGRWFGHGRLREVG